MITSSRRRGAPASAPAVRLAGLLLMALGGLALLLVRLLLS